jgi:hypothetical protein
MLFMLVGYSTHTTGSPATVFNAEALAEVVEDEGRTNVAAPCETDSSRSHSPLLAGAVWVCLGDRSYDPQEASSALVSA